MCSEPSSRTKKIWTQVQEEGDNSERCQATLGIYKAICIINAEQSHQKRHVHLYIDPRQSLFRSVYKQKHKTNEKLAAMRAREVQNIY